MTQWMPLVMGGAFVIGALVRIMQVLKAQRADAQVDWRSITATVVQTRSDRIGPPDDPAPDVYAVQVTVEYEVDGREYTRAVDATPSLVTQAAAEHVVARHPAGDTLAVYVDPAHPATPRLTASHGQGRQRALALGGMGLLAGVVMVVGGIAALVG